MDFTYGSEVSIAHSGIVGHVVDVLTYNGTHSREISGYKVRYYNTVSGTFLDVSLPKQAVNKFEKLLDKGK
jgi:hypothetical protein